MTRDNFAFIFVYSIRQASVFYETDKGKTQENHEILAHKLPAGKRTRSLVHRDVYSNDADLCVVGDPGLLIPKSKYRVGPVIMISRSPRHK